jgi:hypothetical protein
MPTVASAAAMRPPAEVIPALNTRLMFIRRLMSGRPYMALAVTCFVALEVIKGLRATRWHWPMIAKPRIVPVIYMAIEATRSVEPWPGT